MDEIMAMIETNKNADVYFDSTKNAWVFNNLNKFNATTMVNILQYGQLYHIADTANFDVAFYNQIRNQYQQAEVSGLSIAQPKIILPQSDAMLEFGNGIKIEDFDAYKKFNKDNPLIGALSDGAYSYVDLRSKGIFDNGEIRIAGDNKVTTNFYGSDSKFTDAITTDAWFKAAYILGSVQFELSSDTKFIKQNGQLYIDGDIRLVGASSYGASENFDFNGGNSEVQFLNEWVIEPLSIMKNQGYGLYPQYQHQVMIEYNGIGKKFHIENCFRYDTHILLSDGTEKPIQEVCVGEMVMAYDGFGELRACRVLATKNNKTNKWIKLSYDNTEIFATPNHRVLTHSGDFVTLHDLMERAEGTIIPLVSADGRKIYVNTELLFVKNEDTYNFEVEGLHTYIAGGLRVHNDSITILGNNSDLEKIKSQIKNALINRYSDGRITILLADGTELSDEQLSMIAGLADDENVSFSFYTADGKKVRILTDKQILDLGNGQQLDIYSAEAREIVARSNDPNAEKARELSINNDSLIVQAGKRALVFVEETAEII